MDQPPFDWKPVFVEAFAPGTAIGGGGRWDTTYPLGSRNNAGNRELELYVDPGFRNREGRRPGADPFAVRDGVLSITATRVPPAELPRFDGYRYLSGMLSSFHGFAQTYGYFEARMRLPSGKGLWPAFWLLPTDHSWPPEIDVFEVLGDRPDVVYLTLHSAASGRHTQVQKTLTGPNLSAAFHDYGVRWTPSKVTWYLDGVKRFETDTPDDMHKPMFMLINLAVGGGWPGSPDASTRFPATMQVQWVRAYAMPDSETGDAAALFGEDVP